MTCVTGHLTNLEFPPDFKKWDYPPPESLFEAPVNIVIPEDKKHIAKNIEEQARYASGLVIWTDCDREGEYIGHEICDAAAKTNPRLQIKRARFSNIEQAHILQAARNLAQLDQRQVDAVSARIELDLRIGYAFTRLLTNSLRPLGGPLSDLILSYGSCQFPTLGFVVDRYLRVKNFVPEPFWAIQVTHVKDGKTANFSWARHRLFDRLAVFIFYERCIEAKVARVTKVQDKPTKKWKPLPLTTVELQKAATRMLRMTGQHAMKIAEDLYNKGFISYPRTETDRFDRAIDLRALVQKQTVDARWGQYAQTLLTAGGFQKPREGRHDDKAHPPIHPITNVAPTVLSYDEGRLYEYVVRRFLACCSQDAIGSAADLEIEYGEEVFSCHGVIVLQRNYLDVFIYENWNDSAELPSLTVGEKFEPTEALMTEGKTSPPSQLTEADLIALMDANGIGTDATMAEHIQKIQDRGYVSTAARSSRGVTGGTTTQHDDNEDDEGEVPPGNGRGGRGGANGRGRGRGRGRWSRGRDGRGGSSGNAGGRGTGVREFIPTSLGIALILGFDRMNFEISLGKPFLRKEMETKMKAICEGQLTRDTVLRDSINQYHQVFRQSQERLEVLLEASRQFVLA